MILGAGGFIGSHLSRFFLNKNAKVHAYGRNLDSLPNDMENLSKAPFTEINKESLLDVRQPDYIYFLIGSASVARSIQDPLFDFCQSIPPLLLILEKLRTEWLTTRLIFISSAAVYGENASDKTCVNSLLKPLSPYGLNKKISEEYISYYCEHYKVNAKIIRPFSVYGPSLKKQLIWDVLNKIAKHENHFFGSGDELRDWIYIDDFINILGNYVDGYDTMNDILNIGSGLPVSVKHVIDKLYRLTDTRALPSFVDGGKEGDPKHLVSDYNEQECIRPFLITSLDSGLSQTVDWFKQWQAKK